MRKFLSLVIIAVLLYFCAAAFADDVDLPATGDLWDNWTNNDDGRQVKSVSDEEFDKAVEQLDKKINKRKYKQKKKQMPKGEEFSQSNETDIINEQAGKDTLPVICIPVELKIGEEILPVGHYQIKGEKDGNNVVLKFYQSQYMMAQLPAVETTDDFDAETITFAKWEADGENKIKVMYGSMDFNAYTIIEIKE